MELNLFQTLNPLAYSIFHLHQAALNGATAGVSVSVGIHYIIFFSKWFVLQLNFLKFDEDLDLVHKCRIKDVCPQLIPAFDSFTDSLLYLAMDAVDSRNTCC